ncbi:hypothetical protein SO802_014846 [Lithocarpus litseifolius]|uniref:Wound-responsive family protein n=2 Tax=Fagaceae TaxID=3503 RepID=A0AAW2CS50_9ROSI
MSATSKASWMVAASIGAVEALKDQGVCRWNYPLRSLHQHAKNNIRSYYQAKKLSAQSSSAISSKVNNEKLKQSEESLRKVIIANICIFVTCSSLLSIFVFIGFGGDGFGSGGVGGHSGLVLVDMG